MGLRFAAWNLLLYLFLVMCAHSEELTGDNHDARQHETRTKDVHDHDDHPSSHMNHMDPSSMVFFTLKDLKQGEILPIYFRNKDLSDILPHLLPKEEADSIPFSLKELPYLLERFSLPLDSPQARAMTDTLNKCETLPIEGEIKWCPTSFEAMLDFARSTFLETDFRAVHTRRLTKSTTVFQNYTILEVPQEIFAPEMIACHSMPYPYAVFYCHSQITQNRLFSVSLGADNGNRVEGVAVCHMDTSKWSRDHASFRVLGIQPGSSHVCHFFQPDNLIFVPTSASISAM